MGAGRNLNPKEKALLDFYYNKSDFKEIALNSDHRKTVVGNPHSVTKAEVGLGDADNTSDADKPLSDATQIAFDAAALYDLNARALLLKLDCSNSPLTGQLNLATGTITRAPIKMTAGILLSTPIAGAVEYNGCSTYITNVATQRAIDRTSDVAVSTVTVASTTDETTLWTGIMPANSLCVGNMFKFHCDGKVSNDGSTASDEITIRIKVGGVTKVTLSPDTKRLTDVDWHLDVNGTQRTLTVGAVDGTRAIHAHLQIGDPTTTGDDTDLLAVADIDTSVSMDVTVTAQWASADVNNTISLYQGFMEYKN